METNGMINYSNGGIMTNTQPQDQVPRMDSRFQGANFRSRSIPEMAIRRGESMYGQSWDPNHMVLTFPN